MGIEKAVPPEPQYVARGEMTCLQQITALMNALRAFSTFPRGARERALAITKLQEAHMWLSASIEIHAMATGEQAPTIAPHEELTGEQG